MMIFFAISLLQYMAANFAHPITPTLIVNLQLRDYMFGAAFAAMSFTNFLFSPFWGKMREFFSVRRLILLGCVGYGFGQYLFSIATTELEIILARCAAGFFVGAIGVAALLYITEMSEEGKTGENLAKFVIVQALGAAGGYLIGGTVGVYSIKITFLMQALTLVLCGILYFFLLQDNKVERSKSVDRSFWKEINPLKAFWDCRSFMTKALAVLFVAVVLTGVGSVSFDQSFNYYLKAQFQLTPIYNGVMKAITGIITLVAVSTVCMKLMKMAQLRRVTAIVSSLCAGSVAALFLVEGRIPFFGTALLFFSFNAVCTPLIQDCVAREATDSNRNLMMGFYNASRSLGMIGGALFAGFLYNYGARLPFVLAGICFALAAVILWMVSPRRTLSVGLMNDSPGLATDPAAHTVDPEAEPRKQ